MLDLEKEVACPTDKDFRFRLSRIFPTRLRKADVCLSIYNNRSPPSKLYCLLDNLPVQVEAEISHYKREFQIYCRGSNLLHCFWHLKIEKNLLTVGKNFKLYLSQDGY